jgi:hypothetical protein
MRATQLCVAEWEAQRSAASEDGGQSWVPGNEVLLEGLQCVGPQTHLHLHQSERHRRKALRHVVQPPPG